MRNPALYRAVAESVTALSSREARRAVRQALQDVVLQCVPVLTRVKRLIELGREVYRVLPEPVLEVVKLVLSPVLLIGDLALLTPPYFIYPVFGMASLHDWYFRIAAELRLVPVMTAHLRVYQEVRSVIIPLRLRGVVKYRLVPEFYIALRFPKRIYQLLDLHGMLFLDRDVLVQEYPGLRLLRWGRLGQLKKFSLCYNMPRLWSAARWVSRCLSAVAPYLVLVETFLTRITEITTRR